MSASLPVPLDNRAVARTLSDIADLLELKGDNPFKIRAYRNAADVVNHAAEQVSGLDEAALRGWNGIGKDLAGRIREIALTGDCAIRRELLTEFPATLLDVLRLQGVGPKTVAVLHRELRIKSLDDLTAAAKAGRLRAVKGMGAKKEQLILQAIEEQQKHAGRHLLSRATETAEGLVAYLQALAPTAEILTLGSVRRGAETCGDLDILAAGAEPALVDAFIQYPGVERVLAKGGGPSTLRQAQGRPERSRGTTRSGPSRAESRGGKASVLMRGGFQADLRIVKPAERGAAMQYFTGSKAHNIVLRDRALARGWKLNEYGLFDKDGRRIAGATEEEIYAALGMAFVPPELRENRGEIEAAAANALPKLIEASDLKGDVHMHTTESDGRERLETMAAAAQAKGLEYIAITDHTQSLAMANGLDETRTLANAERIRTFSKSLRGFTVLAGAEVDILSDGRLDLTDDCLKQLDVVIVSLHSHLQQDENETTRRMIRAIENPYVDIVGHPTARWLLRRDGARFTLEKVIDAAVANGVALEINSQPHRLDLCDSHARLARDKGAKLSINSDAHELPALNYARWGILTARRAWLTRDDVINTRPLKQFKAGLRRHR